MRTTEAEAALACGAEAPWPEWPWGARSGREGGGWGLGIGEAAVGTDGRFILGEPGDAGWGWRG